MNIKVEGKDAVLKFVQAACERITDNSYKLLEKFGEGYVYNYPLNHGLSIIVFDIKLKDPLLFHWSLNESMEVDYYLFHNARESEQKFEHQKVAIIEEGEVLFSDHNERRRIWMPGLDYKVFAINFSSNWFTTINTVIPFPKHIWTNLQHTSKLYLHHLPTPNTSLVSAQILHHLENYKQGQNTYLEIKCIELIYYVFTETLKNINERPSKTSIHPKDLEKLNEFMGSLYKRLDAVPEIEQAADELGMSGSKFQRIFKSLVGDTYYSYVLKTKMDVAMEQLLNQTPVSEVAYNLGYSSIGNFTNAFKRCFDTLPSEVLKHGNTP